MFTQVPHWLDACGKFDASDMNYTKNQLAEDLARERALKATDDDAVRAFRQEASKAPVVPDKVLARPKKAKEADIAPALVKRRRVAKEDAPAPAPVKAPPKALGGLLAYSDSDSDSEG